MNENNLSFDALPSLVCNLISEVAGLRSEVKELRDKRHDTESDNRFIGIDEACKILRRSKSTIYHMVRDGILPHYKVGKMLEFRPSELIAWQAQHQRDGSKSTAEIMEEMKSNVRHAPKSGW